MHIIRLTFKNLLSILNLLVITGCVGIPLTIIVMFLIVRGFLIYEILERPERRTLE